MDIAKWVVVAVLVAAAAAINVVFSEQSLLYRVLGIVALSGVAAFVAFQTVKGAEFAEMLREARIEIRKVVWPTRQETFQTTLLVLAAVVIAGLFLWGIDTGLGFVASKVIG
jgi:preprotein translocase subunit SecE